MKVILGWLPHLQARELGGSLATTPPPSFVGCYHSYHTTLYCYHYTQYYCYCYCIILLFSWDASIAIASSLLPLQSAVPFLPLLKLDLVWITPALQASHFVRMD